jgi:hypothetical protein
LLQSPVSCLRVRSYIRKASKGNVVVQLWFKNYFVESVLPGSCRHVEPNLLLNCGIALSCPISFHSFQHLHSCLVAPSPCSPLLPFQMVFPSTNNQGIPVFVWERYLACPARLQGMQEPGPCMDYLWLIWKSVATGV